MEWIKSTGTDVQMFNYKDGALYIEFSDKFDVESAKYKNVPKVAYKHMKIESETGSKPNDYTLLNNFKSPEDLAERFGDTYDGITGDIIVKTH